MTVHRAKSKMKPNNTSGCAGVFFNTKSGKRISQIYYLGKEYYLGSFLDKEDAIRVRQRGEEMQDHFLEWYLQEYPKYRGKLEYQARLESTLSST